MTGAAFWDHTLGVYRKPGVGPACIALQDRRGADVNILLFALWHAAQGHGALNDQALADLDAAVTPWRTQVVERLRAARNAIRHGIPRAPAEAEALRKAILAQEIEGERIAHEILGAVDIAPVASTARAADAAASLLAYARRLGFTTDAHDRADLRALLLGAFPDAAAVIDKALS